MKTAVLVSAILHIAIIWLVPASDKSPGKTEREVPAVSYVGIIPETLTAPYERKIEERDILRYSHFGPPEAGSVIIDPPEISYDPAWSPPAPSLKTEQALDLFTVSGKDVNILEDSLSSYTPVKIPFEERVSP